MPGRGTVAPALSVPRCRRRPTRGAERGARTGISASPAASTSVRWRASWWACGAASAWRTWPISEHRPRGAFLVPALPCRPPRPQQGHPGSDPSCRRALTQRPGCIGPCTGCGAGAGGIALPVGRRIYSLIQPGLSRLCWQSGALQKQPPLPAVSEPPPVAYVGREVL